jgi:hypothetical protein
VSWRNDKRWSDQYIPAIKRAVGPHVLVEACVDDDQRRNTDLIVLRADSIRIGCRVRTSGYFARFPHDITIRSGRPSGTKTEMTKIIEGWGDLFFYGHAHPHMSGELVAWYLVSLTDLRVWLFRELWNGRRPATRENADGSSDFVTIDVRECQHIVVAQFPEASAGIEVGNAAE